MAQPESALSRKIMDALRAKGWFCFKVHGNEYTMAGVPDIICCAQGYFIGVETKMPSKRKNVSTIQQYRIGQINEAYGYAFVACSPVEALRKIKEYLEDKPDISTLNRPSFKLGE